MQIIFSAGAKYDFGTVIFSEQEIIDFALIHDPLEFHTNREVAKTHLFKGIVASGKQAFHHFHIKHWIPKFGHTVLCGLSVNNWYFLKPIYANASVRCIVTIAEMTQHPKKNSVSIKWKYEFLNEEDAHFQSLEMTTLHKMDGKR